MKLGGSLTDKCTRKYLLLIMYTGIAYVNGKQAQWFVCSLIFQTPK